MNSVYKITLVQELPPHETTKPIPSVIGGFGLPEDDPILQTVVVNLQGDEHNRSMDNQLEDEDDF